MGAAERPFPVPFPDTKGTERRIEVLYALAKTPA